MPPSFTDCYLTPECTAGVSGLIAVTCCKDGSNPFGTVFLLPLCGVYSRSRVQRCSLPPIESPAVNWDRTRVDILRQRRQDHQRSGAAGAPCSSRQAHCAIAANGSSDPSAARMPCFDRRSPIGSQHGSRCGADLPLGRCEPHRARSEWSHRRSCPARAPDWPASFRIVRPPKSPCRSCSPRAVSQAVLSG
eukprot:scaffold5014_cov387-Prasinococcus_capsulatus_cf.AAC.15